MSSYWTKEKRLEQEQRKREVEKSLLEAGCQIGSSSTVRYGGVDMLQNKYECPAGFRVEGLYREAEPSLLEGGCQYTKTWTGPEVVGRLEVVEDTVWNFYECPTGSKFGDGGPYGGRGKWKCLVSPASIKETDWFVKKTDWDVNSVILYVQNGEVTNGECVPPLGQGGAAPRRPEDGPSPRGINVKKIAEPGSSDSQGESAQQQANSDDADQVDEEAQGEEARGEEARGEEARGEEAQGEEARGEENKALNQSQAINNSKQGYGCSANP